MIGSTAFISTIEFEPVLVEDLREQLEKLFHSNIKSRHSETWGDDNEFSHMRATLMARELTFNQFFHDKSPLLNSCIIFVKIWI